MEAPGAVTGLQAARFVGWAPPLGRLEAAERSGGAVGYAPQLPRVPVRAPGLRGATDCVPQAGRAAGPAPCPSRTVGCSALPLPPFSARLPGCAALEAADLLPCQGAAVKRVATARLEARIRQNCQPRSPARGNDQQGTAGIPAQVQR